MAVTTPPTIDPLPEAPSTDDPDNFDPEADALLGALPSWQLQVTALGANVYANAQDAAASASAALTHKNNSQTSAQSSYDNALISIDAAANSATARNQAQAARDAAQAYAAALVGTSTTSLVIGVGSKVFGGAGLAGKQFYVSQRVRGANPANIAQRMDGVVAAYTNNGASSSLTVTVDNVNPATNGNTVANWVIGPGGEVGGQGATGGVTGGNLTGALNEKQAPDVAFSATPDIWSGSGGYVALVGTGTLLGFTDAPQVGAHRTIRVSGSIVVSNTANMQVQGSTFTAVGGDLIDVHADSAVNFFVLTLRKRNGLATNDGGYMQVQDQKASGTGGGIGPSINTETTRVINTTVSNSIPGASLSSNQLTLTVAGTYDIVFRTPGNLRHRARLYDVTNAATAIIGQSATVSGGGISIGERRVTITGTTVFEIRDFFTQDSTDGADLGRAASQSGVSEIYTSMQIRKVG